MALIVLLSLPRNQYKISCRKALQNVLSLEVLVLEAVNPFSPNINMHILPTILHMFLMVLVGRICFNIDMLSLVIIFFILMTYLIEQVVYYEENWMLVTIGTLRVKLQII